MSAGMQMRHQTIVTWDGALGLASKGGINIDAILDSPLPLSTIGQLS